ncbi:nucleotidyltransferase/DNA polymerase involved in DNA repair [Bosea sp. BE271]|uniref:hypothetical protein n=1 Tax=Bosea TaxID=85413 RepID=UPI00285ADA14|nr:MULTISPECIES: hypothetical protein [Bosea]MDR6828984.1 nucleotidyltransferase/DNA polymerase involved in DNA repair [Bosea robiniae]MDR6895868.1 nucleotidyltransferase/DNA polymerase involved in DNA repair [Bosea sp. BE109]MDR7139264.1 nucleotidyltransferase/DNA polymerase involved in DNA repair [Bosea sp. BE168]MDR7175964.1 nucleotidyltransferase/DNA polymerase involved in DNA repair [Bosea sp. BE271]
MPLDDFRGIGAARQTNLKASGCKTAAAVAALDPKLARQTLTVVGALAGNLRPRGKH